MNHLYPKGRKHQTAVPKSKKLRNLPVANVGKESGAYFKLTTPTSALQTCEDFCEAGGSPYACNGLTLQPTPLVTKPRRNQSMLSNSKEVHTNKKRTTPCVSQSPTFKTSTPTAAPRRPRVHCPANPKMPDQASRKVPEIVRTHHENRYGRIWGFTLFLPVLPPWCSTEF